MNNALAAKGVRVGPGGGLMHLSPLPLQVPGLLPMQVPGLGGVDAAVMLGSPSGSHGVAAAMAAAAAAAAAAGRSWPGAPPGVVGMLPPMQHFGSLAAAQAGLAQVCCVARPYIVSVPLELLADPRRTGQAVTDCLASHRIVVCAWEEWGEACALTKRVAFHTHFHRWVPA